MDLLLGGRRALVTGGSRGIGLGIVSELAAEGADVIFCGRDTGIGKQVQAALRAKNYQVTFLAADVMSESGLNELAADASGTGRIDILVNNVGGANDPDAGTRPFENIPPRDWQGTFQKCVFGAAQLAALLLGPMRDAGWGRIINISSTAGQEPEKTPPDYAAAKAAMNSMTVGLAQSLARTGVTVNTISPGPVLTDAMKSFMSWGAAQRGWDPEAEGFEAKFLAEFMPLKTTRMGRPEDIGAAVAFLASARADFITGANLRVDGGVSHTSF